jgi:HK97 family phage portal protein
MTIYQIKGKPGATKATPISIEDWARYASGSGLSSVTAAYAASVWAYRCINIRAQSIAGVPLLILDGDEALENHPLNDVFSDEGSDLIARVEYALCIWGKAFLEITRAPIGNRRGLHWLNPGAVTIQKTAAGIERFDYTPQRGGAVRSFAPDEVVYLHTFDPHDDLGAISPLEVALTSVGVDQGTRKLAQSFFENGARIEGILSVPGASNQDIDGIEAKWRKVFRGVGNWFKTLVIGSDKMTYQPISYPMSELALADVSAETRRDICAVFGVPPVIAGAWEAANYATSQEQRQSLYTETLLPEMDFIADQINLQYAQPLYPGLVVQFDVGAIDALREDALLQQQEALTRNQALEIALRAGLMTPNEARLEMGLDPLPGGDEIRTPVQPTGDAARGGAALPEFFR